MKLKKYINIGSGDSAKFSMKTRYVVNKAEERKDEKKMDCVDDMCIY